MIGWGTILYGAGLTLAFGGLVGRLAARDAPLVQVAGAALAAAVGAIAWNAILRATHGQSFFVDAPIVVLPASWQDTGSGVFALATTTLIAGLLAPREQSSRVLLRLALAAGLAAFLVDVYLY